VTGVTARRGCQTASAGAGNEALRPPDPGRRLARGRRRRRAVAAGLSSLPAGVVFKAMTERTKAPLLPAYIIAGTDEPKVRRTLRRLKERIVEESGSDLNIAVFDVLELQKAPRDASEILTAIVTPSLVLGHRVIIVLNADKLKAALKGELLALMDDMPPDTTVALVGGSFTKTDKLLKAAQSRGAGGTVDQPPRRADPEWLGKRARDLGLQLSPTEARHLARLVGEDAWRLDTELAKLAAYVGALPGQEPPLQVASRDIDAVCVASLDVQVWDLTDAVGRRDSAAAFRALEELIAGGDQRRTYGDPLRGILAALSRHLANLRRVHSVKRPTADAVAKELDIHPFRARKLVEQAQAFPPGLTDRALTALARADAAMVGASQLEPEFALERALAEILHS
jgi:DNA polymerase III delta subunit